MTLFSSIQIQGNLISEDLLQQIAEGKAAGQQPVDMDVLGVYILLPDLTA